MNWYGIKIQDPPRKGKVIRLGKIISLCSECGLWVGEKEQSKSCARCGMPFPVRVKGRVKK